MDSELGREGLRELARWRPEGGVLSVYAKIDHGDRGEGWRLTLRDALEGVEDRLAARVWQRFPEGVPPPSGRAQIGFLEARAKGREIWHGVQMEVGETLVRRAPGPFLAPLVRLLDDGWPVGVVVVALERVRVLERVLGRIEELDGWELETTALDWQERKSPQRNPQADGTGTTASGREQHMQRLEHNRERFLKEAGGLVGRRYGDRDWRLILIVGEGDLPQLLAKGLGERARLVREVRADLIRERPAAIGERLAGELEHLNREREEGLVRQLEEAVGAEPGAALGAEEVLQALTEGRARHVIFAADRDFGAEGDMALSERMIELALATSADVTPAEGLAAQALERRGGAAALLRY